MSFFSPSSKSSSVLETRGYNDKILTRLHLGFFPGPLTYGSVGKLEKVGNDEYPLLGFRVE